MIDRSTGIRRDRQTCQLCRRQAHVLLLLNVGQIPLGACFVGEWRDLPAWYAQRRQVRRQVRVRRQVLVEGR